MRPEIADYYIFRGVTVLTPTEDRADLLRRLYPKMKVQVLPKVYPGIEINTVVYDEFPTTAGRRL